MTLADNIRKNQLILGERSVLSITLVTRYSTIKQKLNITTHTTHSCWAQISFQVSISTQLRNAMLIVMILGSYNSNSSSVNGTDWMLTIRQVLIESVEQHEPMWIFLHWWPASIRRLAKIIITFKHILSVDQMCCH